jgi:DNA processing protein
VTPGPDVVLAVVRPGLDGRIGRAFWAGVSAPRPKLRAEELPPLLARALGLPPDVVGDLLESARTDARSALAAALRAGLSLVRADEPAYPAWLSTIADPPVLLWVGGDREVLARPSVAVVGARDATPAGLAVARRLAAGLAEAGLVVVSGLARGVDGAAHGGALDVGGLTVGVLGCGADIVYPRQHRKLTEEVRAAGAVVSELPPGTPPLPRHFPLRNRIISGLARAVVVIEASERSGSLITARMALEQGRDVLAVPGGVASGRHRGCHALIKDGARLVETVGDILEEIGWHPPSARQANLHRKSFNNSQLEVVMAEGEAYCLDELAVRTGRPVPGLLAELGRLEVAGRVVRIGAGSFVRLDASAMDRE